MTKLTLAERLEMLKEEAMRLWLEDPTSGRMKEIEQDRNLIMQKLEVLKNHPYDITQGKDGRWVTYYKKEGEKRKQIRKTSRADLEDALIKLYGLEEQKETLTTFDQIFKKRISYMQSSGQSKTAARLIYDYKRYLSDSPLVSADFVSLVPADICEGLVKAVKKHSQGTGGKHTTCKNQYRKYMDLKGLMNKTIDFAVANRIVEFNSCRSVPNVNSDVFDNAVRKTDAEQIYSDEEELAFSKACMDLYNGKGGKKNITYLALMLNSFLGLRAGELSALKLSDFDFDKCSLRVCREEVKNILVDDTLSSRAAGVKIVDHLKCHKPERTIYFDGDAVKPMVEHIVSEVEKMGHSCDEWLFIRRDGNRMTSQNIVRAIERANARAGIKQKGNHSLRKTLITKMIQSGDFSTTEIMRHAGHSSYETTQKYYAFIRKDESSASKMQKVSSSVIKNTMLARC